MAYFSDNSITILNGDCRDVLATLPDQSVNCCVTSPPYFGLRDYGTATWDGGDKECDHRQFLRGNVSAKQMSSAGTQKYNYRSTCGKCGAVRIDNQIGLEPTPDEYVAEMVKVFREVKRVLQDDGTLWLNIGDSYATGTTASRQMSPTAGVGANRPEAQNSVPRIGTPIGLKTKDLVGIPWLLAFALRADGWWLRQDIIWCLSGGTHVYARTQKGDMPMMIRDLARLNPATVKLWNGRKWTQLLGISRTSRNADEIELVLRSGERVSCTPTHQFPTNRGVLRASEIKTGDCLQRVQLPEPESPLKPAYINEDAMWLAGLYIAEGSRSEDTIQIAGHIKETARWERLQQIAADYGGKITRSIDGNNMSVRLYGKMLNAIINHLVTGKTAKNKGVAPIVWQYSNYHLTALLDGYLSGDGYLDWENNRWRLGFTRNYNLERDIRTLCARLGYRLTLNLSNSVFNGQQWPSFRGEIRKERSGHFNEKDLGEVVDVRKARCREVYDLGVEDDPHLFALASGILTHNSKPNPMPESVTDRCTKAHEYIFLLSKSQKYYYNAKAIAESATHSGKIVSLGEKSLSKGQANGAGIAASGNGTASTVTVAENRNKRSVWTVSTSPYADAHFATFPPDLIRPCILAGCPEGGTVLDPFAGSGTTLQVAEENGCKSIGIELNLQYCELIKKRLRERSLLSLEM